MRRVRTKTCARWELLEDDQITCKRVRAVYVYIARADIPYILVEIPQPDASRGVGDKHVARAVCNRMVRPSNLCCGIWVSPFLGVLPRGSAAHGSDEVLRTLS